MATIPIFDGHNDFLLRLLRDPAAREQTWLTGNGCGHMDLPRIREGGFAGGFFAIYIASPESDPQINVDAIMGNPPYSLPLPEALSVNYAQPIALSMLGHLQWMERVSDGAFTICRTPQDVRDSMANDSVAGIVHMEGAEAIAADLDALYTFHEMGLRSLGPVWSRPTIFGHGVPFKYPGTPDIGPGLTDAGVALVTACNELGIMIDLSHLNEQGFNDVATLSNAPLVATHSNAHALTPAPRNLTDEQLAAIRDSDGMVGLNFATIFLRPDGRRSADMTLEPVLRHLDHLINMLGEDHVGFGSDFDGAEVPKDIEDVAGLPRLVDALREHGYSEALLRKLCHENWLSLLDKTLKSTV